jgi:hypothetical protein
MENGSKTFIFDFLMRVQGRDVQDVAKKGWLRFENRSDGSLDRDPKLLLPTGQAILYPSLAG